MYQFSLQKTFSGVIFWGPIAVNRYQIEPGYVPVFIFISGYLLCLFIYFFHSLNVSYILLLSK